MGRNPDLSGERRERQGASPSFSIDGRAMTAEVLEPGLYVVATPIGNLGDITLRALRTLAAADLIACEDTRVTRVLLDRYAIAGRLLAYHEHNAEWQRPKLLAALAAGQAVALVSDAGTPLVSDPGYRLVLEATAAGHRVMPVPGASALLAALVASGLPTDTFLFAGFPPARSAARRTRFGELAAVPATLVFYESPQRVAASLADMAAVFGGARSGAWLRELTKKFEEVRRGTLAELAEGLAGTTLRGEIVIVAGPPGATQTSAIDVDAMLTELLAVRSVREAAEQAAVLTGLPRRQLYQRALSLKGDDGD